MTRAMILTMLALSLAAPPSLRAAEAEATTSAPAVDLASMSLPDLWRDACLWEVGSNAEKVPAARRELIARGQAALDYIVPGQLDTKDTLITRAHGVVITGIGAKAIEPLRQALRAEQPNVRRNAADLLGQLGDTASATAIAELLKTPETPFCWVNTFWFDCITAANPSKAVT